ncbi:hypothetical protein Ae201684P_014027 [Aphanomyces euteiches]|nr:hypothetical protein Ae201684P_014027 [Aphanomyces euteiches]
MSNIPNTMRAVGSHEPLPIDNPSSLVDLVLDVPTISGRELLVQIKAVAVNPADCKFRLQPGELTARGFLVLTLRGVLWQWNAEYQAVDERLVALKPSSLSFGEAAGLPATTLTAYDSIFNRLEVSKKDPSVDQLDAKSALIINGAGGVGSMVIQLLKELTDVTVIATASRPKSSAWVTDLGADHAVNHNEDIPEQLQAIGIPQVDYILVFTDLPQYFDAIVEVIKPYGKICAINPFTENLPFQDLFMKSVTFVWECMATRFAYATEDLMVHHRILSDVGALVDSKRVRSIVGEDVGVINAANLKKAHAMVEAGHVVGKLVLTGF